MNIKKIILTSDILRIDDRMSMRLKNPQSVNINMIEGMWRHSLEDATNKIEIQKICGDEGGISSIRHHFFKKNSLPLESSTWAYLYHGNTLKSEIDNLMAEYFSDALIIGFEMAPYMLKAFREKSTPFINVKISPIRFLNDYLFEFETNDEFFEKRLNQLAIDDDLIKSHANSEIARSRRVFPIEKIQPHSAVYFGQTEIDAALINDFELTTVEQFLTHLLSVTEEHEKVYFKHHPHSKSTEKIIQLIKQVPRVFSLEANAYAILGSPNVEHVAAISSGILDEAKYFNIPKISRLIPANNKNSSKIIGAFFHPKFWDYILNGNEKTKHNEFLTLASQGMLKNTLNMQWAK